MDIHHPLERAIQSRGLNRLARELGLTHQALRKWQKAGRMPRTEWTGETAYAIKIADLTDGKVSVAELLGKWPELATTNPSTEPAAAGV